MKSKINDTNLQVLCSFIRKEKEIFIISGAYFLVNSVLFVQQGVKVVNDTHRYIGYATELQSGFYFDPHNFWYIGYSLYILIIQLVGGSYGLIIAGQYLLNFIAVFALYQSCILVWQSKKGALITVLLFILFIDVSSWNSYVLTESLYTSFICFSLYGLAVIHKGNKSFWYAILIGGTVLFTSIIKPTGIALLGALLSVSVYVLLNQVRNFTVKITSIFLISVALLLLANRMLTTFQVMENYQIGEVIYATTTVANNYQVDGLILNTPENIYRPPENYAPLVKVVSFFFHHPVYWLQLFFTKTFYLLAHVRPFWSFSHNLFSVVFLVPCYIGLTLGMLSKKNKPVVTIFVLTYLFLHIFSIGVTSDDWDGRFLIPMLPVVFSCAAQAIVSFAQGDFKFWYSR